MTHADSGSLTAYCAEDVAGSGGREVSTSAYVTARNQLKAIYQKTDTLAQAQLIALITRLAKSQILDA